MSQEMRQTLQAILNNIQGPAFVTKSGRIILTNEKYKELNYSHDELISHGYNLEQTQLGGNLILNEYEHEDIFLIKESQKKLTEAMALL